MLSADFGELQVDPNDIDLLEELPYLGALLRAAGR